MKCPNCHQPVEAGAAFCGNCGQPILATTDQKQAEQPPAKLTPANTQTSMAWQNQVPKNDSIIALDPQAQPSIENYAVTKPTEHTGEVKALLSLLLGIVGIAGALFMALIGLILGIVGLIMGTMSYATAKRKLSIFGLVASSLAVLVGLAVWAHAIQQSPKLNPQANANTTLAASLNTPCYSANLVDKFNVINNQTSCDMNAFNGQTLASSTDAYKVYASKSSVTNVVEFSGLAKQALEKDVKDNLAGFSIDGEGVSSFAGSPAYSVNTIDQSSGIAVIETAVLHQVKSGYNIFILVHAINGTSANLQVLESQWQWK